MDRVQQRNSFQPWTQNPNTASASSPPMQFQAIQELEVKSKYMAMREYDIASRGGCFDSMARLAELYIEEGKARDAIDHFQRVYQPTQFENIHRREEIDQAKAIPLYKLASKAGCCKSTLRLGDWYWGDGEELDAFFHFRLAYKQAVWQGDLECAEDALERFVKDGDIYRIMSSIGAKYEKACAEKRHRVACDIAKLLSDIDPK